MQPRIPRISTCVKVDVVLTTLYTLSNNPAHNKVFRLSTFDTEAWFSINCLPPPPLSLSLWKLYKVLDLILFSENSLISLKILELRLRFPFAILQNLLWEFTPCSPSHSPFHPSLSQFGGSSLLLFLIILLFLTLLVFPFSFSLSSSSFSLCWFSPFSFPLSSFSFSLCWWFWTNSSIFLTAAPVPTSSSKLIQFSVSVFSYVAWLSDLWGSSFFFPLVSSSLK